jgi:hypothetical protein
MINKLKNKKKNINIKQIKKKEKNEYKNCIKCVNT